MVSAMIDASIDMLIAASVFAMASGASISGVLARGPQRIVAVLLYVVMGDRGAMFCEPSTLGCFLEAYATAYRDDLRVCGAAYYRGGLWRYVLTVVLWHRAEGLVRRPCL
jgi:hypothetical protein